MGPPRGMTLGIDASGDDLDDLAFGLFRVRPFKEGDGKRLQYIQSFQGPRPRVLSLVQKGSLYDKYHRESQTVAKGPVLLGRSQDVCEGSRCSVQGERCLVGSS